MRQLKYLITFRLTRFTLAGAVNTTVNFAVLNFMFYALHLNKMVSIVIATSFAIVVSFILNRNFVFLDKERSANKLVRFVVVSVLGVFLVQNSVYGLGIVLLSGHETGLTNIIRTVFGVRFSDSFIDVNLSNTVASFAVLFWNYNGYKLFVFNGKR